METENLGNLEALRIKRDLNEGIEKTLVDGDLINHLQEVCSTTKLIMIEDENGYHLISAKSIRGSSFHSIIAMVYMLEFEKSTIKILGGGRIKMEDDEFIIFGKSGSFDVMENGKVSDIMKNLNINFKMSNPGTYPRKGSEYSFTQIANEVHKVLED